MHYTHTNRAHTHAYICTNMHTNKQRLVDTYTHRGNVILVIDDQKSKCTAVCWSWGKNSTVLKLAGMHDRNSHLMCDVWTRFSGLSAELLQLRLVIITIQQFKLGADLKKHSVEQAQEHVKNYIWYTMQLKNFEHAQTYSTFLNQESNVGTPKTMKRPLALQHVCALRTAWVSIL